MPDIELLCPTCEQSFIFSEAEQEACTEQAYPPPTFCPQCLRQRKQARDEERDKQRRGSKRRRR